MTIATSTCSELRNLPVFGVRLPVWAHPAAEMDKGPDRPCAVLSVDLTDVHGGANSHCTLAPVLKWPNSSAIPRTGFTDPSGREMYEQYGWQDRFSPARSSLKALQASGEMIGEAKAHPAHDDFFEKGDKPLEIVTSRPVVHPQRRPPLRRKLMARICART